jgi:hypothetical protein
MHTFDQLIFDWKAGSLRYGFQHKQDACATVFNTSRMLALRFSTQAGSLRYGFQHKLEACATLLSWLYIAGDMSGFGHETMGEMADWMYLRDRCF